MPDQNIPERVSTQSSGSYGARKLTPSCSRCRASKLKCDRKEPCMECIKRNVGHLCTKDEIRQRRKRTKKNPNATPGSQINTAPSQETEAEDVAQVLEQYIDGTPSYQSASVAPDYPNTYWFQKEDEKRALIREIVDSLPEVDVIHALHQVFVTRCQGPLGNIVHTPTFMKQAEALYDCLSFVSPEERAIALSNTVSMDMLACHILALVLSFAFHPTPSILGWVSTPLTLRVEELRASDRLSKTWSSLALHCLRGRVSLFCGSIASLQAAVMLLLNGQEEPFELDTMLVSAISAAQKLGLHRLGEARLDVTSDSSMDAPHIRTEIGIRIWWALAVRDWSRGQLLGYYSIRPTQFNTRMPLHINDDDLCQTANGDITERPRSEFTMLSYTVHAIEIALLVHESIDPHHQEKNSNATLNKKYEKLVSALPPHFRLGSTIALAAQGPMAAIPVHRWMLHQHLWSLFLRLHRSALSSTDGRSSCQLLAQHIITTQAQIQARCTVCGSLSTAETRLFSAAMVLILDLLFPARNNAVGHSIAQLGRLMARDKVREAIALMSRSEEDSSTHDAYPGRVNSAQRSVFILESLMGLEEEEFDNNEDGRQGMQNDTNASTLKNKVMQILSPLQTNTNNTFQPFSSPNMHIQSLPTADSFQDLDVLPILSNDPNCNFWQFVDFSPLSPLPFSTTGQNDLQESAGLQTITGSMPFTPSSDGIGRYEVGGI
ncbi:hypothetical protein ASPWEDRAFT_139355 [Aspergillus wentii DTO 134E9]|uniref:Zn(2)-C6 fungal-type domain-containing protein n=1 Tax=Aspergillus wentii DTO 134E9 TaxID=1073089 RepID=A0A1L9RAU3_ASPWE|nr:uncharacterized protein ASPWEDRAFT_139355 [Aspergillus wentii DTO 134E9]OJJ31977.1 hypothetical protein ASPWEDRAFT_139355 [Aspergillus wentii DTO 134E9]